MTEPLVQTVMYLGRPVDKALFRAYIYGADGATKLVNSWKEYREHMETGLWIPTSGESVTAVVKAASEKGKREKKGVVTVKDDHHPLNED